MKHTIILGWCLLIVVGALVLAVHTNNQVIQTAKVHASNVTKQVKQDLATRQQLQNQVKEANAEVSKLQTQCEAGLKDYQLLTSYQRLQGTVPVCALQNSANLSH